MTRIRRRLHLARARHAAAAAYKREWKRNARAIRSAHLIPAGDGSLPDAPSPAVTKQKAPTLQRRGQGKALTKEST